MISVGRVLIKPCGEWKFDTTYHMLDLVNYNGYAYLAKGTVVGIEPSADIEYWLNLLDLNKVIEDGIAGALVDNVGDILEKRFAELLNEARYVTDLFADYDAPTFVRWDTSTENTPYKAGLTSCYEGYALVFGKYATSHSVSAWAKGGIRNDCFTHTVGDGKIYGWDSTILASGGTMTGDLRLGGGKGVVSADETNSFLESTKDDKNYRRISLSNPSDEDTALAESAKIVDTVNGVVKGYNLFGEHNFDESVGKYGVARIYSGSFNGDSTKERIFTFPIRPKLVCWDGRFTLPYGVNSCRISRDGANDGIISLTWKDNTLTMKSESSEYFGNNSNRTIYYAILY